MNAENAVVKIEAGETPTTMTALTDSGDHLAFNSAAPIWSKKSGFAADVKPNGLATGGAVTPAASGTAEMVDVAALTCYLAGVKTSVAAETDVTCVRATPADTHIVNSITVTAAGAIAVVTGTGGTAFSETRDAAGGPPLIPVGSVEIGQVRFSSTTGVVVAADIYATVNTHVERYDYPIWEVKPVRVENRIIGVAGVDFSDALPLIHTGGVPKKVYAAYNEPDFVAVPIATDYTTPETSHSTSSTQYYRKTVGSVSSSIGQGGFTAALDDGISDHIVGLKNETLWFKFLQDELREPYILCNGKLGIARTFPAASGITAACTISPLEAGVEVIG
jgi:hypothetical protein